MKTVKSVVCRVCGQKFKTVKKISAIKCSNCGLNRSFSIRILEVKE